MAVRHRCAGSLATVAEDDAPPTCSARDCRAPAAWELRWNNPRLHDAERRKVWLACPDHRGSLGDFLGSRGFLRETVPFEEQPAG